MDKFKESVPFDPGYFNHSISFIDSITPFTQEFSELKANHQKKFRLSSAEIAIINLIKKCTAFYLGCILWGGFIHCKFKDNPKIIIGNNTKDLSKEELEELDCARETKYILKFIQQFDRDCKYFLRRPAKIDPLITEIALSYEEFVKLNDNFININYTDDIELPQSIDHFKYLNNDQLDNLYIQISEVIDSGKLEDLLKIGFYKIS